MIKRAATLLILGALLLGAGVNSASAAPLQPPLAPPFPRAGESILESFIQPGNNIRVDWIVTNPSAGLWNYYFQVENYSTTGVSAFSVTTPVGGVTNVGFLTGSLDANFVGASGEAVAGHVAANYSNLGPPAPTEVEPALATLVNPNGFTNEINTVSWSFTNPAGGGNVDPQAQSAILFFQSNLPPVYGNGQGLGGSPPGPFASLAPGGNLVPVPTPEPSTLLLALAGPVFLYGAVKTGLRRRPTPAAV